MSPESHPLRRNVYDTTKLLPFLTYLSFIFSCKLTSHQSSRVSPQSLVTPCLIAYFLHILFYSQWLFLQHHGKDLTKHIFCFLVIYVSTSVISLTVYTSKRCTVGIWIKKKEGKTRKHGDQFGVTITMQLTWIVNM